MEFPSDDFDTLIAAPKREPKAAPQNFVPVTERMFTERCPRCGGSGRFGNLGQCFKCKGSGKMIFKTTPETRAKNRAATAQRKANEVAENLTAFAAAHPDAWAWMNGNTFAFAVAMVEAVKKYGSLTDNQLAAVHRCIEKLAAKKADTAARIAAAPVADSAGVDRLKEAFDKAIAAAQAKGYGLKMPRITIGDTVISPAKANSTNPGALYVKSGGTYLGKIKDGKFFASRDCSAEMQAKVLKFVADPKGAAEAYGIETGVCCICNAELTNPVSKARGIGPICAQKFGW